MDQVPSTIWRTLAERAGDRSLPRGLDAAWDAAVGIAKSLVPRRAHFLHMADQVLALEKEIHDLSDARLREACGDAKALFRCGRDRPRDLIHGFALVREVAFRQLAMRPFRVQVAGALALNAGCIVEMATGEGKTLTATMPATLNGWRERQMIISG